MKLVRLQFAETAVSDLGPLQGMPLQVLHFPHAPVSNLAPLEGMKLNDLHCASSRVSDLTPLRGMPLHVMHCRNILGSDLSPLEGMPLLELSCDFALFGDSNEEVLRSLPLKAINGPTVKSGQVPAEYWKEVESRRQAANSFAKTTALLPVKEQVAAVVAKLNTLNYEDIVRKNAVVIRKMAKLKQVNGQPAAEYLDRIQ